RRNREGLRRPRKAGAGGGDQRARTRHPGADPGPAGHRHQPRCVQAVPGGAGAAHRRPGPLARGVGTLSRPQIEPEFSGVAAAAVWGRSVLLALVGVLLIHPALALNFPTLSGRVVDEANILDAATQAALTQKLADLESKSSDQLVVVTLRSLQGTTIEDFGV